LAPKCAQCSTVAPISPRRIDRVAPAALEHRIMLNYAAHSDNVDAEHIVEQVIKAARTSRA
jgi:hypothetical protein